MAAFQQRRQQQQQHQRDRLSDASPPLVDEPSTSSDLAADDSAVLLFGSRTSDNQATSASWSVIRPPRSVRTTSFTSSVGTSAYAATDTSGGGGDDAASSSLGSPLSFTQASLLPAHAGDGVFLTAAASAGSLVMSDDTATEDSSAGDFSERDGRGSAAALFPSIYADLRMADSSSSDDGRGGTAFSAYSHISRRGGGGGDRQAFSSSTTGGESFVSEGSEWALTEAALSTHRALAGDHVTPRLTRTEENEEEEQGSVELTSGSEDEAHAAQTRQQQRPTTAQAQASLEKEEQDWAQSAHALSAGFLPASRRPRRAPPPSLSYTRDPQAPPITVLLPRPGSSSLRSLSPAGSLSARSRRSSSSLGGGAAASGGAGGGGGGFKRRHRQAGTGRSSTSQKRSVVGAANLNIGADDCVGGRASLSGQALFLEQVAREEENRARRMTAILEQRREEVRLREAEAQVLFGHAIRNYMSVDPISFALLAEAAAEPVVPLAPIECTPTPSRAHSPSHLGAGGDDDDLHGAEAFIAHAVREGRFAGGVRPPREEEADSGTETETEHDSDRAAGWARYSLAAPESRPSRLTRKKNKNAPPLPTRSRSTSELVNVFDSSSSSSVAPSTTKTMGTFSPITGSGLTARGVHSPTTATPHRRSSSFSGQHHFPLHYHYEEDGRPLSHEERIMLGERPSSSAGPASIQSAAHHGTAASPWGGDVDSFELALNYWKRMWRRLRGTTTVGGGATSAATAAASTVAHSSRDDEGYEVRSAAGSSSASSSAPMRLKQQKTVDLLVPEARVGRV